MKQCSVPFFPLKTRPQHRELGKKLSFFVPSGFRKMTSETSGGILLSLTSSGFASRFDPSRSTKIIFSDCSMPVSLKSKKNPRPLGIYKICSKDEEFYLVVPPLS